MAKKIFFNACSYDEGGWFICEAHDWPYKHKTTKPIFVVKPHPSDPRGVGSVSDDSEVREFLREEDEVGEGLHKEMVQMAHDMKLTITDLDGNEYKEGDKIVFLCLDNDDGKKLSDALIAAGWEKQFIPIGP